MPELDDTQVTLYRRRAAMKYFEAQLAVAHQIPKGEHPVKLYELAGDMIGRDTPIRYLEFGVFGGMSMRNMGLVFTSPESEMFGFDSFEGLPENWQNLEPGTFSTKGEPPRTGDKRVRFIKGWFQNTVPQFLAELQGRPPMPTLVHYDADLYSSTLFLASCLWFSIPEYWFIFDEFFIDEVVAMRDFCSAFPVKIELFGKTGGPMQVFGKLTRTDFVLP